MILMSMFSLIHFADFGIADKSNRLCKSCARNQNVTRWNRILAERSVAADIWFGRWHSNECHRSAQSGNAIVARLTISITSAMAKYSLWNSKRIHEKNKRLLSTRKPKMVFGMVSVRSIAWRRYSTECKHIECIPVDRWTSPAQQCAHSSCRRLFVLASMYFDTWILLLFFIVLQDQKFNVLIFYIWRHCWKYWCGIIVWIRKSV